MRLDHTLRIIAALVFAAVALVVCSHGSKKDLKELEAAEAEAARVQVENERIRAESAARAHPGVISPR